MLINHHEIPLLKPCLVLILGILVGEIVSPPFRVSSILIYAIIFFLGLQLVSKISHEHSFRSFIVLLLISCLGICLVQERSPVTRSLPYDITAESFTIRVEKLLPNKNHKKLVGSILSYQNEDSVFVHSKGKVLVYFEGAKTDTSIIVGNEYYISGNLSQISQVPNPYAFDYSSYLKKERIYHQVFVKKKAWQFIRTNRKSLLHSIVHKLQVHFKEIINRNFADVSNRALVMAMVLGDRTELGENQKELFINTGAIHVLAVSGLHVGILALFISFIFKLLDKIISIPKLIQGLVGIFTLWLFAMITGASSAVCRAALMFSMFYLSRDILHRHVSIYNIIFGSAFILLLYEPMQVFKVSFQFSYLAVLSIVFFYPFVNNWLNSKFMIANYFWSSIAIGISAQVLVFPISIFYFNKFASSFFITSIFVVQLAMIILVVTLLILIFDSFGLSLISDTILSPICNWVLSIFQQSISKVQALPYSYIDNIWIDRIQLIVIYIALAFLMLLIKCKKIKYLLVIFACLLFYFAHSNYKSHSSSIQHKAYIYKSSDDYVDIFVGNQCYSLHTDSNEGEAFVYGRNRLAHDIQDHKKLDEAIMQNALEYKNGVLRLGDIFLAFANEKSFTEVNKTYAYNYLLVNKVNNKLKEFDLSQIRDSEIILMASLPPWKRNEFIEYCSEANLNCFDIKKQGAKEILF